METAQYKSAIYYYYIIIFKVLQGKFPIPLCRRGRGAPPTPQGCLYHDEIVLLYNFLLLLFFNLKGVEGKESQKPDF